MKIFLSADPEIPVPPDKYGGIERIVEGLIGEFRRLGHHVAFAGNQDSKVEVDYFAPWPGLKSGSKWDTLKNMRALSKAVKHFRPDVVHSFSRLAYMLPIMSSKLPKIMSYQREPTPGTVKWASMLSGPSLKFTGCSQYIANLGKKAAGEWEAIPNFVNLAKFDFVPEVESEAPLVFLSRIEEIKGTHIAIEVAKRTGKKLIIAGNHSADTKARDYWNNIIFPTIDNDQICYVGPVNDQQKNALLGSASAMIVPIQWDEPFGIVFAESLACGTPIISCPRGALPEIVSGGTGDLERIGGLGESIEQMENLVRDIKNFSRAACRTFCKDNFDISIVAPFYIDVYGSFC